ncbi:uncharacterized protein LOC128208269 isoform X2 [Mya arenaria]|nr:uncharacterized protein LOC128208269 isoform X2 [Mya arenaria]
MMATEKPPSQGIDLPSFNLSQFINYEDGKTAADFISTLRNGQGQSVAKVKEEHTEEEQSVEIHIENQESPVTYRQPPPRVQSTRKEMTYTIDPNELLRGAELLIKVPNEYSRFRYESEKTKGKKGRTRHVENDDADKQCLIEIKVSQYVGTAKVIAYCCDANGYLHPFHLFGDNSCHRGVYVRRFKFRPEKVHRLTGVSVVMPTKGQKEKDYLSEKQGYLEGELHCKVKTNQTIVFDKQLVHVKVVVMLEESGKILQGISTALNNRKQGTEFRIDDIQPCSAPACGNQSHNFWKNKVLLVVSDKTFFPGEPGIIIRQRDELGKVVWETMMKGDDLTVVKKAVVKFVPPPYRNPDIMHDVEVEVCLADMKTKKETAPIPFTYTGADEYGMQNKARKRKLTMDDHNGFASALSDQESVEFGQRAASAYKKRRALMRPSESDESSSEGSSLAGQSYTMMTSVQVTDDNTAISVQGGTHENMDVVLHTAQQGKNVPFSSYTSAVQPQAGQSFSQMLSDSETHTPAPLSGGFAPEQTQAQTATSQVYQTATTEQQGTTSGYDTNIQTATPANSQLAGTSNTELSNQLASHGGVTVVRDDMFPNLPKLKSNQQLLLINGQFVVLNDDTVEPEETEIENQPSVSTQSQPQQNKGNLFNNFAVPRRPATTELSQLSVNHGNQPQLQRNTAPLPPSINQTLAQQNSSDLMSSGLQALLASWKPGPNPTQQPQQQQQQQQLLSSGLATLLAGMPGPNPTQQALQNQQIMLQLMTNMQQQLQQQQQQNLQQQQQSYEDPIQGQDDPLSDSDLECDGRVDSFGVQEVVIDSNATDDEQNITPDSVQQIASVNKSNVNKYPYPSKGKGSKNINNSKSTKKTENTQPMRRSRRGSTKIPTCVLDTKDNEGDRSDDHMSADGES